MLLILCLLAPSAEAALPPSWHGTWAGTLRMTNAAGKTSEVPLTFTVAPIKGSDSLTWKLRYGDGEKAAVKDYKLVPVAGKPGAFRIDEGGGVLLDARLAGDTLYCHFAAGETLLTSRYEKRGDAIRFEVTSAVPAGKAVKGVRGYAVGAVQSAELKRK